MKKNYWMWWWVNSGLSKKLFEEVPFKLQAYEIVFKNVKGQGNIICEVWGAWENLVCCRNCKEVSVVGV